MEEANQDPINSKQVPPEEDIKKRIWIILAFLVVVLASFFGTRYFLEKERGIIDQNPPQISNLENGQFSELIPNDLPFEEGVVFSQNYEAQFNDGRKEGSVQYLTQKTKGELVLDYVNYFMKNNWVVVDKKDSSDLITIIAENKEKNTTLNLTVGNTLIDGQNVVAVSAFKN